jgi:hypothetical protein
MTIKSIKTLASGMAGGVSQTIFPVSGPVVTIPLFTNISQIMKHQADAVDRLVTLVGKLIDEFPDTTK